MTEKKIFEKSVNDEKKEFSDSKVVNPNPRMTFLFLVSNFRDFLL